VKRGITDALASDLGSRFKSRARLEAENLVRQQINGLIRKIPTRTQMTNSDRLLLACLYRLLPSILNAMPVAIFEPLAAKENDLALGATLEQIEAGHIRRVLAQAPTLEDAADWLGIGIATLWRKRKRYHIE